MYLGIDLGTSAVKAVLLAEDGTLAAQASSPPLAISRPRPLFSEQDPYDWWRAVDHAVRALDPSLRRKVRAIGLAGQMHGATLLGADDRPLRPAILWNDGRSDAECVELEAAEPRTREISGNAAMAGFTAPKLLWVRRHEPELFAAVRSVLLPKDYVRLRMTGGKASDMSDASGTLWLDVAARRWSPDMLAATGLDERTMPELFEGSEVSGTLRRDVAEAWGMEAVRVAAGGGDNAAAAVGAGVIGEGDAFLSLGTSGVAFVATDRLLAAPAQGLHAFCHALPGRWHQMSVMLSAAACLDWATGLLGFADVPELLAAAERAEDASAPIFLPYLNGERTPHADPYATGVFFGLTAGTGREAAARAVLDGVAMGLRDGVDVIAGTGSDIRSFTMVGGGSRSQFWGRLIAAALDRPLVYREAGEVGPAFGAARLARIASGEARVEEVCAPPPVTATIEPEPRLIDHFAERQPRFRALYAALKPVFREP
ncbi:MAG: xylulokinase [Allosphingosinicella sp.]|uniref:xylulokinase n=1 Tax=Allosphingosinicella sp. TaxID=2823234 RepID=UPI00392E98CF